jgi:hypothetical protein
MSVGYRGVPTGRASDLNGALQLLQAVCNVLNGVLQGKTNNVATVTCTAGATTTVVTDPRIGPNSAMPLDATTANAAAELGAGTAWWSSKGKGTATLAHSNAVSADRTFRFPIIG